MRPERNLSDIIRLIEGSSINSRAKETAVKIFKIVAQAEAEAHGLPVDMVHFHEVSAVDSIVDIVAVAVCLEDLGLEEAVVSTLSEGQGHAHCSHGLLPVPVPAVLNIAVRHGLFLHLTDEEGEMVTPTGAAIAAALKTRDSLPENFFVKAVGLGAGKKEFKRANLLRAMIIEETPGFSSGHDRARGRA